MFEAVAWAAFDVVVEFDDVALALASFGLCWFAFEPFAVVVQAYDAGPDGAMAVAAFAAAYSAVSSDFAACRYSCCYAVVVADEVIEREEQKHLSTCILTFGDRQTIGVGYLIHIRICVRVCVCVV